MYTNKVYVSFYEIVCILHIDISNKQSLKYTTKMIIFQIMSRQNSSNLTINHYLSVHNQDN